MSNFNIVPAGHNKSVYFILPLTGLSKSSYGEDNFLNSYVSYNAKIVAVVKDKEAAGNYMDHEFYVTDFDVQITDEITGTAIVYNIPKQFEGDLSKFLDGKYSEMSLEAKQTIYANSGLPYRFVVPGQKSVNTHKLLLVLEKSPVLKRWIEATLLIEIPHDQELLDKPSYEAEYMDIDTIVI